MKLVICSMVKDEEPYLAEWVLFHRLLGVEHFFLMDMSSTDGTAELLRSFERLGVVTMLEPSPAMQLNQEAFERNTQMPAPRQHIFFADSLPRLAHVAEWVMACCDCDRVHGGPPLTRHNDAGGIY